MSKGDGWDEGQSHFCIAREVLARECQGELFMFMCATCVWGRELTNAAETSNAMPATTARARARIFRASIPPPARRRVFEIERFKPKPSKRKVPAPALLHAASAYIKAPSRCKCYK